MMAAADATEVAAAAVVQGALPASSEATASVPSIEGGGEIHFAKPL